MFNKILPLFLITSITLPPLVIVKLDIFLTSKKFDIWENFTQDPGPWCEEPKIYGLVKEKSNAYSDYIFLLISMYLLARSYYRPKRRRSENLLTLLHGLPYLYFIINLFHGIGTFINHSCRCSIGHKLDTLGMYSIINFWVSYYIVRYTYYRRININFRYNTKVVLKVLYKKFFIIFSGLSITIYPIIHIKYSNKHHEIIEFLVVALGCLFCICLDIITQYMCKRQKIYLYFAFNGKCLDIGVVVVVIGAILQKLDINKIFCYPNHFLQLHAIWHFAAATTMVMAFEHAYSEFSYFTTLPHVKFSSSY